VLPVVLAVLPGLVAGLAGAGNCKCPPSLLSSVEVSRVDPAADAGFAASRADNSEIANDERGKRDGLAKRRLRGFAFPNLFSSFAVACKDTAVERD
jgi:hypothetical protein